MNNENTLNSAKIDSHYFYNSQESKLSRISRKSSNKDNNSYKSPFDSNYISKKNHRGGYSYSLDSKAETNKAITDKFLDNNSFSEIENRIKRAPKNSIPPQHLPKQSIRTIKGNLYEALNNINKELNVKIEKREFPKIRMSLLDYLYHNSEEQPQMRRNSKKVDIDDVMENLSIIIKDHVPADSNFTPLNNSKKEFGDDLNIEGILENLNLNKSNSFNTLNIDKFGNLNTNNPNENMNSNNMTIYFSGPRLASEVEKNKMINQMHSNYSSIHGKHSSIPYYKKKNKLKSFVIDDEVGKNPMGTNGYNSQGDFIQDEKKLKLGLEEVLDNKNFESVKNEGVYVKNKVSPNRKVLRKDSNNNLENENAFLESNCDSNLESQTHMNNSQNIHENLIQFNSNNLIDSKEKEIFHNFIKNEIFVKKANRKMSANSNSSECFYRFDFKQFLKFMKNRELEISNKEFELNSLKKEIAYLIKDVEGKNSLVKSIETKKETTDSELKFKIRELESQLNSTLSLNSKLEKENGILKNELVNNKKNKNFILKRFNEEMLEINKLRKDFFDNYVSMEN